MIGPHYQRLAEAERQITGKQMLQRVQSHTNNPLTMVIDKLKRQFLEYETAYTEDIANYQISSVDRLLSYDGKLGPILAGIEKENNLLRRELSLLESQLSNSVSICEQVIAENNDLKQALLQKNADISKIIETVARNQSQSRNELEDKIAVLEQQNSILVYHLQEIKKKHEEYQRSFAAKDDQIQKWEKKWTQNKKHLSEAINRQRDVTRKLAISEHLLFEWKQKFEALDNSYNLLLSQNSENKSKIVLLETAKDGFDPEAYRRSIENEYLQIINEHKTLKNERHNILRQAEKSRMEKQKLEDILNEWERKSNKLISDSQLKNNLLVSEKEKNQSLIATLKKAEAKLEELRQDNVNLKIQADSTSSAALIKQKSLERDIEDLRKQLHERSTDTEKKLKQLKHKTSLLLDGKDQQIKRLNEMNTELRRAIDH